MSVRHNNICFHFKTLYGKFHEQLVSGDFSAKNMSVVMLRQKVGCDAGPCVQKLHIKVNSEKKILCFFYSMVKDEI